MRSKKLLAILNVLPESDELNKVKNAIAARSAKTASFILKCKKYGRYLLEIYLVISWVLQYLGIV